MPSPPTLPALPLSAAHFLAIFFSSTYVGSLYISKHARLAFTPQAVHTAEGVARRKRADERWRDDPDVIRARLVAVSLASMICCGTVGAVVWTLIGEQSDRDTVALHTTFDLLGIPVLRPFFQPFQLSFILVHFVTPILFLGALYTRFCASCLPLQRNWSWDVDVRARLSSWQGVRNYFIAPLTEEIVFRACTLAVYHLAGASRTRMIFLTPLTFGAAHIHHAWDTYNRYGRTSAAMKRAILMSLFQLSYTSIFGWYSAFLFLRTSALLPPFIAHVFCNIVGVPDLGERGKERSVVVLVYLLGITLFMYVVGPWTNVEGGIYWR